MRDVNILLTNGRSPLSLDLARQLHRFGYRVYAADAIAYTICRFSRAITKSFTVRSPKSSAKEFTEDIRRIVKAYAIDVIVPVYEECLYLAQDKDLQKILFSADFETLKKLHNKSDFMHLVADAGLPCLPTLEIKNPDDFLQLDRKHTYALKPVYSRGSLGVQKLAPNDCVPLIEYDSNNPYIAQKWAYGRRFCSYSICLRGHVLTHVAYPVQYTIDGHSCVFFEKAQKPEIMHWVERLVEKINFTGQIAFDFIEDDTGVLYAIECNPRATSGIHLLSEGSAISDSIRAYVSNRLPIDNKLDKLSVPKKKQVATGMLLYVWKHERGSVTRFFRYLYRLSTTSDVVFSVRDIFPFLMQPLLLWTLLKQKKRTNRNLSGAFLFDYEWSEST